MNKYIYILLAVFTLTSFASCGGSDDPEVVVLTSLDINPIDKDLYIGDTYQLTVSHQPADIKLPTLTWESSNTKVATVSSSGKVTAVADGVTTITASYGSLTDNVTLVIAKIQDYTSFVIKNTFKRECKNVVAGYRLSDNALKKIVNLGNLAAGELSKEITVDYTKVKEILLFEGELSNGVYSDVLILTNYKKFLLKENTKNIYTMPEDNIMELTNVNHTDSSEFPQ